MAVLPDDETAIGDTEQHNFRRFYQPLTAASGHDIFHRTTYIKDPPESSLKILTAAALADSHNAREVHYGSQDRKDRVPFATPVWRVRVEANDVALVSV